QAPPGRMTGWPAPTEVPRPDRVPGQAYRSPPARLQEGQRAGEASTPYDAACFAWACACSRNQSGRKGVYRFAIRANSPTERLISVAPSGQPLSGWQSLLLHGRHGDVVAVGHSCADAGVGQEVGQRELDSAQRDLLV